ncbi:MAG: AzlC family ABC transporter permease [Cohaesibacter sp.]|nr:AzlC family ABC transporter permease [Cohaesibacter sp.]
MTSGQLFLAGAKRCIPICIAAGPFGALFGALAVDNGMSVFETVLMSMTIFAGASQMVGVELFGQSIPPWVVVLSIFAVNFRHILYSASLGQYVGRWSTLQQIVGFFFLIDPQYAEAERRVEQGNQVQFVWYMGLAIPTYIFWAIVTYIGALFGNLLQDSHTYGIDFLLPIYFLGLVMGFRKRSFWLPVVATSAIASVIAWHTVGSPWHVSVGAVAGILLAAFFSPQARGDNDDASLTGDVDEDMQKEMV